jgi:hypothetical protein
VRTQSSHGRTLSPVQQQHQQKQRKSPVPATVGRAMLLLLLVLAFVPLGATSAFAITRDAVLARAQTWIDNPVPYSQLRYFGGYRTDCSGYASMCWQTGTSWSTRSFHTVSHPITVGQLKPGDALLKAGYHIRIFYGWVDAAHTRYVAYEQTGPNTKSSIKDLYADLAYGYIPYRYNAIEDSPPSANVLSNGSFNTWSRGEPVWWSDDWEGTETVVVQRRDLAKAGKFSLQLANPTALTSRFVSVEQTAPVSAGTSYTLSAWARTAGDPRSLRLRLRYLDASGAALTETRTTGDVFGIDNTGFKRITVPSITPSGAVTAMLTVSLAGAVDASGTAGNSAVLDELSLVRPQVTISIRTNATVTSIGRTVVLSGSVTPTSAIGTNIVVWVKKPGRAYWTYSSNRTVYELSGGAAWQYKYFFKPGMVKGTYLYRAVAPALPGYLGATSPSIVSIRLN